MLDLGKINSYVNRVLGFSFQYPRDVHENQGLPAPLNHFFFCYSCVLDGEEYVLLEPKVEDVKLSVLIQRIQLAEEKLRRCCILVTDAMDAVQRRQMILDRICFIVPERQLYLPILGTYLTERRLNSRKEMSSLSPASQFAILYHLQKCKLDGLSMSEVAELLFYPVKTVSIIASELQQLNLCRIEAKGKSKALHFYFMRRDLWEKTLPMMSSPIQKVGYTDLLEPDAKSFVLSYDDALSHFTKMGRTDQSCYAIGRRSESGAKLYNKVEITNYPGSIRIEFWKYNPQTLAIDGYIDPLSLYLCYKNDIDERIQGQLQRLIDKVL